MKNSQQHFESIFDTEIKNCNTMNEVLDCVQKHYDLSKPLGIATKILVIGGVKKIIKMVQAVRKVI
jgi:hypothetical protein